MFRIPMLLASLVAQSATAAGVDVQVTGPGGHPVADAVVTLSRAGEPRAPIRFPWPYEVRQQDISFQPHVLIVPVGASVSFPNMDSVRHHVYSFSAIKRFQLKLYGREQARSVVFDKPGVAAIGCNIHDSMAGFVVVVATPYAAKTDAAGHARIADVPAGRATLTVWSPLVRAPANQMTQDVVVAPAGFIKTVALGG